MGLLVSMNRLLMLINNRVISLTRTGGKAGYLSALGMFANRMDKL